jgi:hypothetical protein
MTDIINKLSDILEDHGFDFIDASEVTKWFDDQTDMVEAIQERIYEQDIVYYHHAIKYLSENDPSLMESLELAKEYGAGIERLNSEYLATIHYQDALSGKVFGLVSALEGALAETVTAVKEG